MGAVCYATGDSTIETIFLYSRMVMHVFPFCPEPTMNFIICISTQSEKKSKFNSAAKKKSNSAYTKVKKFNEFEWLACVRIPNSKKDNIDTQTEWQNYNNVQPTMWWLSIVLLVI